MAKITVGVEVKSTIDKVWDSWNTPEHIINWCSGDPNWHTPKAINDLRVGGKFNNRMEARDGSNGFDFEGEYTDVIENKYIKYKMSDGREVETTFEEVDGGVKVTQTFDAEDINSLELQRQGWQYILDGFKSYTENL